jgi:hypothetical protein
MRHNVNVEEEVIVGDSIWEGTQPFLPVLRERMERTLLQDAEEPRKVTIADYLKLVAILESEASRQVQGPREVVVRWEDPEFITKSEEESS